MRGSKRKLAVATVALALLGGVGYTGAASSAPSGTTDTTPTTPPPETTPAPDPAPPAPKPKPKPAPKPTSKPAHVYQAPVRQPTPAPAPRQTYTPPPVTHHVVKAVRHARKASRRHKRAKRAAVTPKVHAQVKHASVVHIVGVPTAAVATNGSDAARRSLVIAGIGLAAILFLLVVTVPASAARFTPPGRVLMDHQTDLVLAGIAILLLSALLFAFTGNG